MAKFLDFHETLPPLSPEMAQGMAEMIKAGQADPHGVTPLNVFITTTGQGYCLCEAPSAEAVVASHASLGFPLSLEAVSQVNTLV